VTRRTRHGTADIITAARKAFLEQGYRASLDDVAAGAGVTRRTIYNKYRNKEDLFRAVVRTVNEEMGLSADQRPGEGPLRDALLKFGALYTELLLTPENISLFRTLIDRETFPDLQQMIFEESIAPTMRALEQFLLKKMVEGNLRILNPRMLSEQFLSIVLGYTRIKALMNVRIENAEGRKAYLEQAVDIFLNGCSKRSPKIKDTAADA
jgi:AcrR family transcriptional regulator